MKSPLSCIRSFLWCCLATCAFLLALAQEKASTASAAMYFNGGVGRPIPNVELPSNVPAPLGKLTLYADFAAAGEHGVPLFLVNRTDQPKSFDSQDGDIYLKLERLLPTGKWERAQSHISSDCGNSYGGVTLNPGQHFRLYGYMPRNGVGAKVRYAKSSDGSLVSNEGDGYVLETDVQAAKIDPLSRTAPRRITELLDPTARIPSGEEFTPAERVAAMRLLQVYGANLHYKQCAQQWAHEVKTKPTSTPEEKKAADNIENLIAPWPTEQDSSALLNRCIKALHNQGTGQSEFGMPEQRPALVWSTVADLAQRELGRYRSSSQKPSASLDPWKNLMGLLDAAILSHDQTVVSSVVSIIEVAPLSDEFVPNAFFEKHLWNNDLSLQRACASALSRRGQHQQLVAIGWKLPPASQVIVLEALAYPEADSRGASGNPQAPHFSGGEEKFWVQCIKSSPIESAYALYKHNGRESLSFTMLVHDALRDFFVNEAGKSDATANDFETPGEGYQWRMAIEFLADYTRDEDIPLFQRLLDYRGYDKQNIGREDPKNPHAIKNYIEHHYLVRVAAKEALLKRGVSPAHDIAPMVDSTP